MARPRRTYLSGGQGNRNGGERLGDHMGVDRFSATLGGALAGVPIVAGPAMFFLWRDLGAEFTALTPASPLIALSASQVFLVVYCFCSAHL